MIAESINKGKEGSLFVHFEYSRMNRVALENWRYITKTCNF